MITFTETEIEWMVAAILNHLDVCSLNEMIEETDVPAEKYLLSLRAEQLTDSANKLLNAVKNKNRRIEIKY